MSDMAVETFSTRQWRRPMSADNNDVPAAAATPRYPSQKQHDEEANTIPGDSHFPRSTTSALNPMLSETKQAPFVTIAQSSDRESETEVHAEEKTQDGHDIESSRAVTPKDDSSSHVSKFPSADVINAVSSCQGNVFGDNEGSSCHRNPQNDAETFEKTSCLASHVVLSLNDDYYKNTMWRYYRVLGKTRDIDWETQVGNEIFSLFKQKMGETGRFFKRQSDRVQDVEVDNEKALCKINADIGRRMRNYPLWSNSTGKEANSPQTSNLSSSKPSSAEKHFPSIARCLQTEDESNVSASTPETQPRRSSRKPTPSETARNKSEPRDGDITLSFNDGRYKEIMWRHFNILGKKQPREKHREETVVRQILGTLKKRLGMGGRFFKKMTQSDIFVVVDDVGALEKITLDVRKRNMSIHKWLVNNSIELCQQQSSFHPYNFTSDHHPLPIIHNQAWRDHMIPSPIGVLAKFQSSTPSTEWDNRPTDKLAFIKKLPSLSELNHHKPYPKTSVIGEYLPKPHDVGSNTTSALEKLKLSHIGQELPPLSTIATTKFVQTPNQLIQMLQLATHKLNELHGTSGKQSRILRLYNLSEFNCYSRGVISSAPSVSDLAKYMKITPVTLKKWFTIYKNALMRGFDFGKLGEERIRDHYSVFNAVDERHQLSHLGEMAIEEYFRQVGKQVFEEAKNAGEDTNRNLTNRWDVADLDYSTRSYNIFDESAETRGGSSLLNSDEMGMNLFSKTRRPKHARREPEAVLRVGSTDQLLDAKSPFGRYFQINTACLATIQSRHDEYSKNISTSIQLDSAPKRLKAGSKDRMLCMVMGCEKHTQAQSNGCCSSHFRMLSSAAASIKGTVKRKGPIVPSVKILPKIDLERRPSAKQSSKPSTFQPSTLTTLSSSGRLGELKSENTRVQTSLPKNRPILSKIETGSRIYVEWNGDNSLYKATVKKVVPDMLKIHYDGKKKHIIDTISLDMVNSFIEGENKASVQKHANHDTQRLSKIQFYGQNGARMSQMRSLITTSPITSPKEVASLNCLSMMNGTRVNSAFISSARMSHPPLPHQLYEISSTDPLRAQFPEIRSTSAARLPRRDVCGMSRCSDEKDESDGKRPKRKLKSIKRFEEEQDCRRTRPRGHIGQSKSVLCHCPHCSKGSLSVQGMYAHYGRAHTGKISWELVTFSCPFCSSAKTVTPLVFGSFPEVKGHIKVTHPGFEVVGPHSPKLAGEPIPARKYTSVSTKNDRLLRKRKAAPDFSGDVAKNDAYVKAPEVVAKKQGPSPWSKIEYVQLLSDGKKEYPRDLCKVIDMIEEQCRAQEEIVEVAREQRMKLCKNEAEVERKALDEERLLFQRGIRERARLADGERIEKQKFTEKAEQMMLFYQYENRNKGRHKEDIEVDKLCARPIIFSNETQKPNTRHGKSCKDDQCLFCNKAKGFLHHLLLDDEIKEFKMDAPATESPVYIQSTKVLNPSCHVIDDGFFSEGGGTMCIKDDGKEATKGIKRSSQSRRDASTAKRVKTEEDRLLMLKNSKLSLEFIKKYNDGMIINAWGETRKKDLRGRRSY